ncbi:MAG: hypothetical protein HY709_04490 [Candidatus Latescibacteria bacterium]|nr:hypothetical protein [Candidatus Latescibacterota bacterium]
MEHNEIEGQSTLGASAESIPDGANQSPITPISRTETTKGLTWLLWARVLWGCYGPVATISGAIFSGFALWMGLGAPQIALLISLSSFVGLIQPFLLLIEHRIHRKRAFIIGAGILDMTLLMTVIGIPPLFPPGDLRVVAVILLVLSGAMIGNMVSPLWQVWISQILPAEIRGRTISLWITITTLTSAVFGYAAGRFLDTFPAEGRYPGFFIVFLLGWLGGIGGYLLLLFLPFSWKPTGRAGGFLKRTIAPFRHRNFRNYLLVSFFWDLGAGLSQPFFSIFMLNYLKMSYSTIALFNNLFMVLLIIGYQFWGRVVDRHGSVPILRLMMVFRFLLPLLWACVSPGIVSVMLPFIMIVQGITFSGLTSAHSPFLYKLVSSEEGGSDDPADRPGVRRGDEVTAFFVVWSASMQLAFAVASAIAGGIVKAMEGRMVTLGGIEIDGLRFVFLLSAAVVIVPNLLLRKVEEPGASTVREMFRWKR